MPLRAGSLLPAAALLTLLLAGTSQADPSTLDPLAQLDRILAIGAGSPAFDPKQFEHCVPPSDVSRRFYFDEKLWCQQCYESGPNWRTSYSFYPDPDRATCTLQQVELVVTEPPPVEPVRDHLNVAWDQVARQTSFIEKDHVRSAKPVGVPYRWRLGGSRAWLYRDQENVVIPRLVFLWRQDRLTEILNAPGIPGFGREPRPQLLLEACEQSGGTGCAALASRRCEYGDKSPEPEAAFRSSLLRLAALKPEDPSYPAHLYWSEWLGRCVASSTAYPDDAAKVAASLNQKYPELAPFKASFGNNTWKGETVSFESPFAAMLGQRLDDRWGRQSFLESLFPESNSYDCTTGLEPAQQAAAIARDFLARYPDTETSDRVRLRLAEACETLWSMSKSGTETFDVSDLSIARPGAEKARQEALAIYRLLAQKLEPSLWLKDKIFRLEHDIDTFERSHVCSHC